MILVTARLLRMNAAVISILIGTSFAALLSGCSLLESDRLEAIRDAGQLVVLTYHSPTTYYDSPEGPAGFDHDLAQAFADYLGVELKIVVADSFADVLPRLMINGHGKPQTIRRLRSALSTRPATSRLSARHAAPDRRPGPDRSSNRGAGGHQLCRTVEQPETGISGLELGRGRRQGNR